MYKRKLFILSVILLLGFIYINKDLIASSIEKTMNPLRGSNINSFLEKSDGYSEIYEDINDLILLGVPVLIKDDVDKYLEDVSKKITIKVIDNTTQRKAVDEKGNLLKENHSDDKEIPSISFDFPNVTLAEFTRFIASLNKKILIGENLLQGNITIKTPKKLTLKRLMSVFDAILGSRGLAYLIAGKYLQIYQKSDAEVKVYQINYLKAKDVAKSLSDTFKMSFNVGGQPEQIMINSLDDANCVVVLAPKARQLEIADAISKLDWRRRQVLLEISVIEITYNNNFGFGVTLGAKYNGIGGGVGPGVAQYASADGSPTFLANNAVVAPPLNAYNSNPYFGALAGDTFSNGNGDYFVDLQANEQISKLKVLNQPKILTSENQQAEIDVGHQEPLIQAQTNMGVSSSTTPATQTSVDWKNIGTNIKITPRVNSKRDVSMDFEMTITSIAGYTDVGSLKNYPIIGQRITKNTSTIQDNHTLVIGGLLKEEKKTQKYKVPFLGDAPYLGWLFTSMDENVSQTELIMFITPRVIESTKDGNTVTKDRLKYMEDYDPTQKEAISKGVKGQRDKSWDNFNLYDYFNNDDFRKGQMLVPQSWNVNR